MTKINYKFDDNLKLINFNFKFGLYREHERALNAEFFTNQACITCQFLMSHELSHLCFCLYFVPKQFLELVLEKCVHHQNKGDGFRILS